MDNEPFDPETPERQPMADDIPPAGSEIEPQRSIGLWWRVLAVAVALVVIGALAYPLIQQQFDAPEQPAPARSPVQTPTFAATVILAEEATTPEGWFELGKDYYRQGRWAQAAAAFEKAIELDPAYQAAYANLGAAYHRQDKLDLAVAQYQKALELTPDDGEVVYNLAAVYIQQAAQSGGQPDPELMNQALAQLNRALELSPDSAEPYFGLGVAYTALNQPQDAIMAFETFLERDTGSDPRARQEAERYLEFLRSQSPEP